MTNSRASGLLLHPTSLPNDFGIGDLGYAAFEFIDFLEDSKQTYWQVLPLGPTGFGDSPYQSFSAFAGNTNLISPEILVEENLLDKGVLIDKAFTNRRKVDYAASIEWKNQLLNMAYKVFKRKLTPGLNEAFEQFIETEAFWLNDYSIFSAIKESQGKKSWLDWDASLKTRDDQAMRDVEVELNDEIYAQKFFQFLFFKQWKSVKEYARKKGVKIVGDIPIFVALDSADVWQRPEAFKLNEDLSPRVVAGVPPDYFSKTGQLWGNPIYDWDQMKRDGYRWWTERVKFSLKVFDIARIDHFRGFVSTWEVPGSDETAENGKWEGVPGRDLFETLRRELGELPIIAEDLGDITPEVRALRDRFGFPGMKVLQFAFGGDSGSLDLPHNYERNCVAYTGTHDNDTVVGWVNSRQRPSPNGEKDSEIEYCERYLSCDGKNIHRSFVRAVWSSVADTAIAPLQDILGLGNHARMNLPASTSGNWQWRCAKEDFSRANALWLKEITETYGRAQN